MTIDPARNVWTPEQRVLQSLRDKLAFIGGELTKFKPSEEDAPAITDALEAVSTAHAILADLLPDRKVA